MSRKFQNSVDESVKNWLSQIADKSTDVDHYRHAMYELGLRQGEQLVHEVSGENVAIACTVEDADFLAKGIIEAIESDVQSTSLACFWNKRISGNELFASTAPILRKYKEPHLKTADVLIIVKSIISGSCVVKTNLMHLIQEMSPKKIFVMAPVMYESAPDSLSREFPDSISSRFAYNYFASDSERTTDGEVIPGIGGSVYERLGFESQDGKNRYTPQLVIARRQQEAMY